MLAEIDGIIWEADADTLKFSRIEGRVSDILGFEASEWLSTPGFWQSRLHPEDADWVTKSCIEASQRRESHRLTYRMIKADGQSVWLQDNVTVRADGQRAILSGVMVDVTELLAQQRDIQRLTTQSIHYQTLYDLVPVAIWEEDWKDVLVELRMLKAKNVKDIHAHAQNNPNFINKLLSKLKVVSVNSGAIEMFRAINAEELIRRASEVFLANAPQSVFLTALDAILNDKCKLECVNTLRRLTGEPLHVLCRISLPKIDDLDARVVICEMDISDSQRAHERFHLAAHLAGIGIWDYQPQSGEHHWSPALKDILGLSVEVSENVDFLRQGIHSDDLIIFEEIMTFHEATDPRFSLSKVIRFHRFDTDEMRWLSIDVWRLPADHNLLNSHVFLVFRDITKEKTADDSLRYAATHDALTGLANREYFISMLMDAVARSADDGSSTGLLLLDVDHLKDINDTHGHDVGDELLRMFAKRLKSCIGNVHFIARLGGDEFAVLILDVQNEYMLTQIAKRIQSDLIEPYEIDGIAFDSQSSIGGCYLTSTCKTAEDLLKAADLALYTAKRTQRGSYALFSEQMLEEQKAKREAVNTARTALQHNEIHAFYQPKIDLTTGQVVGLEALMRWRCSPDGFYRAPGDYSFALEDPLISTAVFARMLENALYDIAKWRALGFDFKNVALNAGQAELRDQNFADKFLNSLSAQKISPSTLQIEIVESVFFGRRADLAANTIEQLSRAGVAIALDDFGTGFAALSHLQQYPVDILKIDKSFIRGLGANEGDRAIVSAILSLGKSFGLDVIAEGVETEAQAKELRKSGCLYAQGYLFYRPLQASQVSTVLRQKIKKYK